MSYLTLVDIRGIQSFIFKSNRLIDAISGSYLVDKVLDLEALKNLELQESQIIINAGGNSLLKFETLDAAKIFAAKLTRELIINKPGLEAVVCHAEFDEDKGSACEIMINLQKAMVQKKRSYLPSTQLEGLSVTEVCIQTGLPAYGFDGIKDEIVSQSLMVRRKHQVREASSKKWDDLLGDNKDKFTFPSDLDDLGRTKGEKSLIAVIHVDGNGIGQKLIKWFNDKDKRNNETNEKTISNYQNISKAIEETGKQTLKTAINTLIENCELSAEGTIGNDHELEFILSKNKEHTSKYNLPIRPIICDGDDITIVTDARVAFDVTIAMLKEFEKQKLPELGKISACAGIAFVHSHYPFSVAYEMAEKLCKSAKTKRKDENSKAGYIDWIFDGPSFSQSPEQIRASWISNDKTVLSMRPYSIDPQSKGKTWPYLKELVLNLQEEWKDNRSKVKKIRELMSQNTIEAQRTLDFWAARDTNINANIIRDSTHNKSTSLTDAIELMDIYLPLTEENKQ